MADANIAIQKRNLIDLANSPGGFQFTNTFFPYTSGQIGPYYVQSASIMANGKAYQRACLDLVGEINNVLGETGKDTNRIISGGESRDWIFSYPVAQLMGLSHAALYKDGKSIGVNMKDKVAVHVADLNNEGSSPRDLWVPAIKAAGGSIEHIFFFVDRMEDGVEEMRKLGLQSHAIIPLDGLAWQYLQEAGIISPEVYTSLCQRMENKDEWAERMLKSNLGLETLATLLGNPKNRDKGNKILNVGYPHLKEELVSQMRSKIGQGVARWVE